MSIDINLTFIAELIAFFLLVLFVRTFIVPQMAETLKKRRLYVNTQLSLLASAEQTVAAAQQTAREITAKAQLQAAQDLQALAVELKQERAASMQKLAAEIAVLRLQAEQEARQTLKNAALAATETLKTHSILLAEKIIAKNISVKENEAIIQEFLRKL